MTHIRNFSIIAHIDHGKSTLADRMLEVTGTIEKRKMREQTLDVMELERERGITIKLAPVRMMYRPDRGELDRRHTQTKTQNHADKEFLYEDLTYKIRGAVFAVRKELGLGHKEQAYHNALEIEMRSLGLSFESRKNVSVYYDGTQVGTYQPDFIVEDKVLIELKALPEIGKPQMEQLWSYLKGSTYKLALLVNFGSKDVEVKRVVYDTARNNSASSASSQRESAGVADQVEEYILNLIDTPGHIDFSYEVSRALTAVEGALLLVDATQGIQAQTLTTLGMAKDLGLAIIPVLSKVDSPNAQIESTKEEIIKLLGCELEDILETSGKTGQGVPELLSAITRRVPEPRGSKEDLRSLVFDFEYSNHRGVIVYSRIFDGEVKKGDKLMFAASRKKFTALEVGTLAPEGKPKESLSAGEVGYIVTGIKEPGVASVGDTIKGEKTNAAPLPGYKEPSPVVWASIYPESQDDFSVLSQSLSRLHLSDSSLSYEEEASGMLGRGYRCGFLGMLHLEIVTERLRREFDLDLIVTAPSITYEITYRNGKEETVYTPTKFPDHGGALKVREPWVLVTVITPPDYVNSVLQLLYEHEAEIGDSETFGDGRTLIKLSMPLRELMRNFFDKVKSISSGFASISYEIEGSREADVVRLDILVADEIVPAFSRVVSHRRVEEEAKAVVEKLHSILPKQLFTTKIQAKALGRVISSKTLSALRKDVTGHLYGGDVTRKKKLLEKQKKGKKRLGERGKVDIPQDVFMKMVKTEG
ncbi:MAG: translation elongation factor 4 [Candidatus Paceibacterota bacterium]